TFLNKRIKIFQHLSYENYVGSVWRLPQFILNSPAPAPTGGAVYGPLTSADPQRTSLFVVDGKYSFGPVSLYYSVPIGDTPEQLTSANGVRDQGSWTSTDRYAILEYKDRFWKDHIGISVKGYFTQFNRSDAPQLFSPNSLFPNFVNAQGQTLGGLYLDF